MPRSKTIKLFLMDGEPSGRIKCSLANWTGIAYKIPRTALDKCKDLDILKQSGVYFLFGTDKADNTVVYIGQAGVRKNGKGLLLRVQEAHNSIDYWTEAVMFTTTNNSFGPTEISYLENRFCNMAIEAGRYVVKNGNDPNPGNITEETESELEEFIDYAKIVMGTLGHKVFEPFAPSAESADTEPVLYHFGVLTSNVHMAWMRAVCGRIKSDYRYSKDIVYNNFPWPTPTEEQKTKIEQTAQGILDARALYTDCSLADLYDEVTMPVELRRAHQANDKAVMAAYGFPVRTTTEASCVAELMRMYQRLVEGK